MKKMNYGFYPYVEGDNNIIITIYFHNAVAEGIEYIRERVSE